MDYGMDYQGGGGGGGGFGGGGGGGRPSSGGGYSTQSGDRGGGQQRKSYDEQTMIPVTIAMALASRPDESAEGSGNQQLADGRKLYHVRMVAATRDVEDHSTNVLYQVEDGTGLMEVKQWIEDDGCTAMEESRQKTLQPGTYLKITGQIKDYDGKKMVVADSIRPLSTGNELTHHMLEVVYAEQAAKRQQNSFAAAAPVMGMGGGGIGFGGGMQTPNQHRGQNQQQPMMQQQTGGGGGGSSNNDLRDAVIKYIREKGEGTEQGASISECAKSLQFTNGFPESDIRNMVDELSSEGMIYSTVDEDHYCFAM